MNPQQKLTDIHMLVTYIKDHMDTKPVTEENDKLDEIGKTTVIIAEMLQTLEQTVSVDANEEFSEYRKALGEITETIYKQLNNIKDSLDNNETKTSTLYDKVEEVYATYVGILKSSSEKLAIQNEQYTVEAKNLINEVKELVSSVKEVNQKILTEDQLQLMLQQVEEQVKQIGEQDREFNQLYLKNSASLDDMVSNIQTAYQHLDETLSSVDESFKTAVSRLDLLLMQANQLSRKEKGTWKM